MGNQIKKITLELPDLVDAEEAKLMVIASLFGKGVLSSGKAATYVNMSRVNFLFRIGEYGISVFSEDRNDLERAMNIQL